MPVIERKGTLPGKRKFRATCSNCGTIFTYLLEETKAVRSNDQRDAGLRQIGCPMEGCTHVVYEGKEVFDPPPPATYEQKVRGNYVSGRV